MLEHEVLWFAFKLVSLNHWKQLAISDDLFKNVVICFQISIFEPLETTKLYPRYAVQPLWFAFKLVSLNHWKQLWTLKNSLKRVVICFQISIFEPLETTMHPHSLQLEALWFAFKLVSLNHWKQLAISDDLFKNVVICFQISIFEPLETTKLYPRYAVQPLWFAFKLVSLNHWKQLWTLKNSLKRVVICFQISIFEPLETTHDEWTWLWTVLWFAFKLVSLNHWKQLRLPRNHSLFRCDLLSN